MSPMPMQAGIGALPPQGPMRAPQGPPAPMGAPPMGAPQGAGPQGADPFQMLAQLKNAPDNALKQMVQGKHPLGSFALAMLNGRNEARQRGQMGQMQSAAGQPTVAQQVVHKADPGVAGLPTGQAIPQQFAGGGIVGYADGGTTGIQYSSGTFLPPVYDPEFSAAAPSTINNAAEKAQWDRYVDMVSKGLLPIGASLADVATLIPRGLMGAANFGISGVRAAGVDVPYMKDVLAPEGSRFESATPYYDKYVRGAPVAAAAAAPAVAVPWGGEDTPRGPVFTRPGITAGPVPGATTAGSAGGIGGLVAQSPRSKYPEYVDPTAKAPPASMTDAEFNAYVSAKAEELAKLYGSSYADRYLKEMQAEREAIKGREPMHRNEAWLRAGLAMMGGKSRHGLQNIGAGGIEGLNAYQAARTGDDARLRELRRDMILAEQAKQARADQINTQAIGRADRKDVQMGQARTEAIGAAKDRAAHEVGAAEFGIKQQLADAATLKAKADMAQASASAAANGDARMMNAITMAEKRIDAAVKTRLSANPMLALDEKKYAAEYNRIWREEKEKELNGNPLFARALGVGSNAVDASSVGLGKK